MHFILDYRAENIAENLSDYGEIILFDAKGMVYPAISGHPDIFISKAAGKWIIAPNTPDYIIKEFEKKKTSFIYGNKSVGFSYPATAHYNYYCDDEIAIVSKHTDEVVLQNIETKNIIFVKQGYIACNLIRIGSEFVTSDRGIEKAILEKNMKIHFVKPHNIILSGVTNGFIGGTAGQYENTVYFTGSERSYYAGLLSEICQRQNKNIIFLGRGEALDVGGIIVF